MFVRTKAACLGVAVLLVVVGCFAKKPKRILAPKISPRSAAAQAMEMYDTNKDGKLDSAELERCPALKDALKRIDKAGEGTITAAKIAARIQEWQTSRAGRMSLFCYVRWQGQPLADADVKFVPEKFLGSQIQPATGKTDAQGIAMMSIETKGPDDPPGVAPGFYRVEITKPGMNIPGRYNSATTLGFEAAADITAPVMGNKFDLQPDK